MSSASWSDEQVESLKRMWNDGLSSARIAIELRAGHSRNAVIGKLHRLGLMGKKNKPSAASKRAAAGTPRSPAVRRAPRRTVAIKALRTAAQPRTQTTLPPAAIEQTTASPLVDEPAVRQSQVVLLEDLTPSNCHWPVGDPRSPDFHFCGGKAEAGHPYCAEHCRMSYQPASPQRAAAMRMTDAERERRSEQGRRIAAAARARREAVI